jgi:uncharacterized membrane protein YoaK (UPF0700 family)
MSDAVGSTGAQPSRQEAGRPIVLLLLLSAVAGSSDAISFLGLNGLFTAHITGNIVVLISHLVASGEAGVAQVISVPVFMLVLGLARLHGLAFEKHGRAAVMRMNLLLHFALLLGFFLLCLPLGRTFDANAPLAVLAGMCGVAAMAVQNVIAQTSMRGTPSTAVLTSNVSRFTVALVESLAGPPALRGRAGDDVAWTWAPILGFVVGAAAGGFLEWVFGLRALLLPVVVSLAAIVANWRASA